MKKVKALALALALTMGTTSFVTGCGNSSTKTVSTASQSEYQYISAADVLKVKDAHILDVREEDKYNDGKNIYIICNSGKRGAEKTTKILVENGIDKSKIFTVEGGAKALSEIDGALKPVQ